MQLQLQLQANLSLERAKRDTGGARSTQTLVTSMTICAFCKTDCQPTREHVIPAFIYAFQKTLDQSITGWNEVAKRMVGGEGKVKDVCANCNNTVLAQLDAYGKQLLIESGLLVANYTRTTLTLQYSYKLLLRWLLKISFNSSRTDGAHSFLFEDYIPFMLGRGPTPPRYKIAILLSLSRAELLGESRISSEPFSRISQGSKLLNPFFVRICYGSSEREYVPRINIFGPAVFHLLMFRDSVLPGHAASAIRRLAKLNPGTVELSQSLKVAEVHAGIQSWLDLYEHQVLRAQAFARGG